MKKGVKVDTGLFIALVNILFLKGGDESGFLYIYSPVCFLFISQQTKLKMFFSTFSDRTVYIIGEETEVCAKEGTHKAELLSVGQRGVSVTIEGHGLWRIYP